MNAGLATPPGRTRPLLFDVLPDLARRVPWIPLAHVPTAVEPCTAIAGWLGDDGRTFMKRDDLVSPLYGGNKIRRYEYVLADAKAKGKRRLVTVGGLGSTQAMATALFGRALGFAVSVVLFDQPLTRFAQETVRALAGAGAEVVYGGGYARTVARTLRALPGGYLIMPGASSPLANLGYVDAMIELSQQVSRGDMPRPDVIVVPSGSAGTLVALALGAAHLGWPTEIVGVRITTALACNRATVAANLFRTDRFLGAADRRWRSVLGRTHWRLHGAELGDGYGHPTPHALEGAAQVAALTGAEGEITYSGKALAALRTLVNDRRYAKKTVLVWNTLSTARPTELTVPPPAFRWMFDGTPLVA